MKKVLQEDVLHIDRSNIEGNKKNCQLKLEILLYIYIIT